jgi:hypothetical protein
MLKEGNVGQGGMSDEEGCLWVEVDGALGRVRDWREG